MRIFSGNAIRPLAQAIAQSLDTRLGEMMCSRFPDGEIKVQILEDVRGEDVFIVQGTHTNEFLMELLIMTDALRRASAKRITAVMPYFGYARQDRKHDGRVPITAKLVANLDMISTAGSMTNAVQVARERGARSVTPVATHPVLCGKAYERLSAAGLDELVVNDTIPLKRRFADLPITVLSVAGLLGEAMHRIHTNSSVSSLVM
ncbi:MAG: ribose-phosphate diphosphokinase [Planctomycetota bacterium]